MRDPDIVRVATPAEFVPWLEMADDKVAMRGDAPLVDLVYEGKQLPRFALGGDVAAPESLEEVDGVAEACSSGVLACKARPAIPGHEMPVRAERSKGKHLGAPALGCLVSTVDLARHAGVARQGVQEV